MGLFIPALSIILGPSSQYFEMYGLEKPIQIKWTPIRLKNKYNNFDNSVFYCN